MAAGPDSERELLRACRGGNPSAAADFVRLHQQKLGRFVLRLVAERAIAEEIVQEAFLRTFREIDRVDSQEGAGRLLWRIAINLTRTHRQRSGRTVLSATIRENAPALNVQPRPDPEAELMAGQRQRRLTDALEKLSPAYREVVLLHYFEELSFPEIATLLGTPAPLLRVRALRARAQLARLLAGEA